MEKFVRSIRAKGDSGREYEVREYVDKIEVSVKGEPAQYIDGQRSLRLASGGRCNFIEDGVFEIVSTGEKIRKVG